MLGAPFDNSYFTLRLQIAEHCAVQISLLLYHILTCAFTPFLNVFPSVNQRSTAHGDMFLFCFVFSFPHISALTRYVDCGKAKLCPPLSYRTPWGNSLPNTAVRLQDEHFTGQQSCSLILYCSPSSAVLRCTQAEWLMPTLIELKLAAASGITGVQYGWSLMLSALFPLWDHGGGAWNAECTKQGSFP